MKTHFKFTPLRWLRRLLLTGMFWTSFWGCTESPFSNDKISGGSRQLRGAVKLSNGQSPEGAYVWLEEFNLGVRSDSAGRFQLTLPPAVQGGDINGVFKLYSFMANCRLDFSEVVVRNGEFVYDKADINKNGELARTPILRQYLRITTQVSSPALDLRLSNRLTIAVILQAVGGDTVSVVFPGMFSDRLAKAFLKKVGSDEVTLLYSNEFDLVTSDRQIIDSGLFGRVIVFDLRGLTIPSGDYEVIPFVLVKHEMIPSKLLEGFGPNVEKFSKEYLQLPFQREGGRLQVVAN